MTRAEGSRQPDLTIVTSPNKKQAIEHVISFGKAIVSDFPNLRRFIAVDPATGVEWGVSLDRINEQGELTGIGLIVLPVSTFSETYVFTQGTEVKALHRVEIDAAESIKMKTFVGEEVQDQAISYANALLERLVGV